MSEFKIEKGVEVPPRRGRYPFSKMDVGDSFLVPANNSNAIQAAYHYGRQHGQVFTVRSVKNGRRIWRVE